MCLGISLVSCLLVATSTSEITGSIWIVALTLVNVGSLLFNFVIDCKTKWNKNEKFDVEQQQKQIEEIKNKEKGDK